MIRLFSAIAVLLVCVVPLVFGRSIPAPPRIVLNAAQPDQSYGSFQSHTFPVGYGRDGFLPEGSTFKGGSSLLGEFKVNAILAPDRFEMTQKLVRSSGKSRKWLEENLFSNMSSIDFDGDGKAGEYGGGFISLEPIDGPRQPFRYNEYQGVFRWYSYAIHGTHDETRIGQKVTGGCINVGAEDLTRLLKSTKLGDRVLVSDH